MEDRTTSSLFRKQALEYYIKSQEKAILPRLVQPPVFLLLWIMLSLAAIALTVVWFGQVPVYVGGFGVVIEQATDNGRDQQHREPGQSIVRNIKVMVLVFVPLAHMHPFSPHVGAAVRLQVGTQGQAFTTVISAVEPGIFSPAEIQQRYAPGSAVSALITGPSFVVLVDPGPPLASQIYVGSLIHAQIQVGSMSVLLSLFGSAQLSGE